TFLKLGSKYGRYAVTASVVGLLGEMITFNAYATAFLADANDDGYANVGDLTTVFDKILDKIELSPENFTRADVDSNNTVDVRDAVIILGGILKGRWDSVSLSLNKMNSVAGIYKSELEITQQGLRFNLTNDTPVKGVQIALRFNNQTNAALPVDVFNRGKHMQIPIQREGDVVRIVAHNDENVPIESGKGSIFRIPFGNLQPEDFEILYVMISTVSNEGIFIPADKIIASTGKYPETFALEQNYPNPFNGETKIRFNIPDIGSTSMTIELLIYDLSGKKIRSLVKGSFEPGIYTRTWNGTDENGIQVSSGMYIYRLSNKERELVRSMIFVK
ncbi:MAG: T9SS type A sorting domain-containing protein, partial [Ignavibacteriales bacterium]|nr:T9SS type A sorting domain-containing protein [Ignavibacteriales bacterium]